MKHEIEIKEVNDISTKGIIQMVVVMNSILLGLIAVSRYFGVL